ncbi:alpha amylase catalytic region [Gloeothece citriformis PCC 7424]|uniref:Alpha amylase catalytic region n=1 Tax=Gloeothece citriformis (strain PCC 7424) TaxID=65393 RepID=B7KCJ7_GLOC7|nr:alpha-amylase family glycosyl hydrolase [Gloeothece citriformis]ACK71548.1 alpha amylase catalytic region [Gloeothece citriformis PCC 7424]
MTDKFTLPEFIFGELSTPQGRLKRTRLSKFGLHHDCIISPVDPQENEAIQISVTVGAEIAVKSVILYYTTDGTLPTDLNNPAICTIALERTEITWDTLEWTYLERWTGEIPGQPQGTYIHYAISAITPTNHILYCPYIDLNGLSHFEDLENLDLKLIKKFNSENKPQIYGFSVDQDRIPQWLKEAVIYEIFVDRFAPSPKEDFKTPSDRSGFYGGTLKGIISKLDYLKELGITCLWLTPIFRSPSHHGYDPISHSEIEPRLGTLEDWKMLVKEAQIRGIRIILDYVINHLSNEHPTFKEAQKDPQNSAYHWFRFQNWPNTYDSFFDVPSQPEINSDYPEVRNYLITNACYWLEQGCDGFRLDYAHGATHAFWSVFRRATRQVKEESVTVGEITVPPDLLRSYSGRMDGCLDFKVLELLRSFFGFNNLTVSQFDKKLDQHFAYFYSNFVLPSFLDNHDMNRFLWIVEGDKRRLKLAALCQFTLPNPPIIYYGTEVGLSQLQEVGRLEESRLPMIWGEQQDLELLKFYQELINLRRHCQFWRHSRQSLVLDDHRQLYVYACGDWLIALNNSSHHADLTLSEWHSGQLAFITDNQVNWHNFTAQLNLTPFSGAVIQRAIAIRNQM